jgi:hypothetical protein
LNDPAPFLRTPRYRALTDVVIREGDDPVIGDVCENYVRRGVQDAPVEPAIGLAEGEPDGEGMTTLAGKKIRRKHGFRRIVVVA